MKQVLGIRDEKERMKVTPPLAVAPFTLYAVNSYFPQESSKFLRWNRAKRSDLICVRYEGPIDFFYQSF